jgi:chemotaxis protein MotB
MSQKQQPHVEEAHGEGAPEWMVSYADMITILMSFFVVMFSMAGSKDPKKEEPVIMSLRRQFGRFVGLPASQYIPAGSPLAEKTAGMRSTPHKDTRNRGLVGDHSRVNTVRSGDQPTIGGVLYFDDGVTQLSAEQQRQLQLTFKDLSGKPQKVEVRGHTLTRSQANNPAIRDNWDLAYQRCYNTMKYLVALGLDPRRIRLGVSAQYEPIYTGRDPLLLEKNSRVEVFMLNEFADELGTGEPAPAETQQ